MVERVQIAKRADAEGIIRGQVFDECEIRGPAILVAVGGSNEFLDCEFTWDGRQLPFIYHALPRTSKDGPLMLVDCTFRRCRFEKSVEIETPSDAATA